MTDGDIFQFVNEIGCCHICSLRFLGVKEPSAYENPEQYLTKLKVIPPEAVLVNSHTQDDCQNVPVKRRRKQICVCCVDVLHRDTWLGSVGRVEDELTNKKYACNTFAVALSSPMVILLRERAITLMLNDKFPGYCLRSKVTSVKEAWKWSFGPYLAGKINKTLDSGSVSPLLITVTMDYVTDMEELECLKLMSPELFKSRSKQKRRFNVEFTRRSVEQALEDMTLEALSAHWECPPPQPLVSAICVTAHCNHAPVYLGGRYIKLSRELSQTPWILNGVRMMESSVQDIIFEAITETLGCNSHNALKLLSAGREDVDVRCLGTGRPFAIEIFDPLTTPSEEDLIKLKESIAHSGKVIVPVLKLVEKDELSELKKGEETKNKTYEALCMKLSHSKYDLENLEKDAPIRVTERDIENINTYTNVTDGECRMVIQQRTPIRVLHRRPLLTRDKRILEMEASLVPEHPQLFVVRLRTSAGTYVKEWVHGDMGRTRPALPDILLARTDILKLDVCGVELPWPN